MRHANDSAITGSAQDDAQLAGYAAVGAVLYLVWTVRARRTPAVS